MLHFLIADTFQSYSLKQRSSCIFFITGLHTEKCKLWVLNVNCNICCDFPFSPTGFKDHHINPWTHPFTTGNLYLSVMECTKGISLYKIIQTDFLLNNWKVAHDLKRWAKKSESEGVWISKVVYHYIRPNAFLCVVWRALSSGETGPHKLCYIWREHVCIWSLAYNFLNSDPLAQSVGCLMNR